jgi:hypothetical protein
MQRKIFDYDIILTQKTKIFSEINRLRMSTLCMKTYVRRLKCYAVAIKVYLLISIFFSKEIICLLKATIENFFKLHDLKLVVLV